MNIIKVMYMASVSIMCRLGHVMSTVFTWNTFAASSPVCEYTKDDQLYKCFNKCAYNQHTFDFLEADL